MTYTEMKNNEMALQVINEQEVLGKQFRIYGTVQEPLFLAKDVAEFIDYSFKDSRKVHRDVSAMLKMVDDDEKVKRTLKLGGEDCSYGGIRENVEMWFLTEYGLYEVLMQSRKPIAKQFKKEVKGILKQIRLTGGYIPVSAEDTDEMIEQRAKEIASKTVAIKDEIIAEQQARIDYLENDVKDCERLIDVLCDDVKYLFNDTDFGVHSVSDAYTIMSHNVNGSRKFVKWFNEHNEKVEVIDVYVDDNGSRIKNAIDLSDINVFHDFKDLVFAYQQEQQGFTRK